MNEKIAFLILSCDRYSELWPAFYTALDRHWSDCPFEKYILTNNLESGRQDIKAIKVGDDITWSVNLKKALEVLKSKYDFVLVTFDDLFLTEKVDNVLFHSITFPLFHNEFNFLQLIRWHNRPIKFNDHVGLIQQASLYRPNCVYALWKIDVLDQLLDPTESAWEFERKGSARSNQFDGFYAVLKDVFVFRNTVIKGRIVRKDAREYNLQNLKNLKVMSLADLFRFRIRYWSFHLFLWIIPRKLQLPLATMKSRLLK